MSEEKPLHQQFLSKKDPVVDIKERLYSQQAELQRRLKDIAENKRYYQDDIADSVEIRTEERCFKQELRFVENLLDIIERS